MLSSEVDEDEPAVLSVLYVLSTTSDGIDTVLWPTSGCGVDAEGTLDPLPLVLSVALLVLYAWVSIELKSGVDSVGLQISRLQMGHYIVNEEQNVIRFSLLC